MTAASEDYSKVVEKIYALQKVREQADAASANYNSGKKRNQEMIAYLKSQPKRVTAYDDHLVFLFKSGIQIEIKG